MKLNCALAGAYPLMHIIIGIGTVYNYEKSTKSLNFITLSPKKHSCIRQKMQEEIAG